MERLKFAELEDRWEENRKPFSKRRKNFLINLIAKI